MQRTQPSNSSSAQVSLVLCSRNRPEMVCAAVESILQGTQVPAEIIVIDQSDIANPNLATLKTDRHCKIRYIWDSSVGLCRANNIGVAAARYDLLVFTHDDVLVAATWFSTLVQALTSVGARTVVTGRVLATKPELPGNFAPALKLDENPAVYEGRIGFDVLKPFNMAMHRDSLAHVGGFDVRLGPGTRFPGAEDSDLGFRFLEAGYRIVYVPEAVVYHRAWRTDREYLPLRWGYGVAQGAFYAKHLKLQDRYMLRRFLRDFKHRISRFPRRLWNEPIRALGDPLFMLGNLVGGVQWLFTRQGRTTLNTTDFSSQQ